MEASYRRSRWLYFIEGPNGVALLEAASLFYVAVPLVIFVVGWLRLPIALILAPAIVFCFAHSGMRAVAWARDAYGSKPPPDASYTDEDFFFRAFLLTGVVAFLVACTGIGGFTFRFSDYASYDGLLRVLIEHPWPVGAILDFPKPDSYWPNMCHYWAYFLPPAVVGRILGWNAAYIFIYFWHTFGVLLSVIWFLRLVGTFRLRYALLFLLFGGIDLIGYLCTTPLPGLQDVTWLDYLTGAFWWSTGRGWMAHWSANFSLLTPDGQTVMGGVFYRFYGMLSFLFDGPNHVLPAWVLLFMVLHDALRRRTVERAFLLTSMLPICSVFVTMGAIPVLAAAVIYTRAKRLFSIGNIIVGPALVVILALYYQSVESKFPNSWLWRFQDIRQTWSYLLLYYASAFGVYVLVAPSMRGNGYRPGRLWFYLAVTVFLLAPWYRLGVYNDFTTKAVIPCQLVFLVCLATAIREPSGKWAWLRRNLLVAALVLGSWAAFGIVYRAIDFGFSFQPPPFQRVLTILEKAVRYNKTDEWVIPHADIFFWQHLARPITYVHIPEDPAVYVYDFMKTTMDMGEWKYFSDDHRITGDGLVITTSANQPLIRFDNVDLDTRETGSIAIEHSVVDNEGKTPDYSIVYLWASEQDIWKLGGWWPFHNWRSNVVFPPRDPLSANSYWRGKVKSMALSLKVDGDPDKRYTVTLRRMVFLKR